MNRVDPGKTISNELGDFTTSPRLLKISALALGIGAISSPVVKMKLDNAVKRDHSDTHFALRWMHKDVTYAMHMADELGVALPTVALTRELLRMAMQRGLGDQDLSALTEVARA